MDPAARRQLLGCQSRAVTVDLMGFLMCLATHQSFSACQEMSKLFVKFIIVDNPTNLEVADGDEPGARPHGELVLLRRPLDAGGGAVDPEQHECVLPLVVGVLGLKRRTRLR